MYLYMQSAAAAAAAAALYVGILLLLHQLPLAAAVRHRVPDGDFFCWFSGSDSICCYVSLHSQNTKKNNECTPWQCRRFYGLDLPILRPR